MNGDRGGQIAKRDVRCVKEFSTSSRGILYAPSQGIRWGRAKAGMVLRRHAVRDWRECGRGVHAWRIKTWHKQGFALARLPYRVAWHCVVPKGTWYHIGDGKFRADAIKLVREVRGSRDA